MRLSATTLTIALCVGIAFGMLYSFASWIAILLFVLALVQIPFIIYGRRKKITYRYGFFIACVALVCIIGVIRGEMYEKVSLSSEIQGKIFSFEGEVLTPPQRKDTTQVFDIKTVDASFSDRSFIFRVTAGLYPEVCAGDLLKVTGKIQEGDVIFPVPPDSYTTFDYGAYLARKDIVGTIAFPKIEQGASHEVDKQNSFTYSLYAFRERLVDVIRARVKAPENDLAAGVLFGTNTLPKEVQDEVRVAGLSHIIVLSGFNVAILVAFVMFVLRKAPFVTRIVLSATLVSLFVIMVGGTSLQAGGASLIRATLMVYVSLLALLLGKEYQALRALFFSAGLYVLCIPQALLYDVSLHLSFLATFGLISYSSLCEELVERFFYRTFKKKVVNSLRILMGSTCAVLICTTPYLIYTFGKVSVYSLIANSVAVPVVPLLMASASLLVLFSFVPLVSSFFAFSTYVCASFILYVAKIVASLPFSTVSVTMSLSGMIVSYVIIFIGMHYFRKRLEKKAVISDGEDQSIISF